MKTLEERQDAMRRVIAHRRSILVNEWYEKKETFGLDNLVGLQLYIDEDFTIKQLRTAFENIK